MYDTGLSLSKIRVLYKNAIFKYKNNIGFDIRDDVVSQIRQHQLKVAYKRIRDLENVVVLALYNYHQKTCVKHVGNILAEDCDDVLCIRMCEVLGRRKHE